jgi:hypothetical protein
VRAAERWAAERYGMTENILTPVGDTAWLGIGNNVRRPVRNAGNRSQRDNGSIVCNDIVLAHVELERARHHDDLLRVANVRSRREADSVSAADEQAAAQSILIERDPVSLLISSDAKGR